MSSVRWPTGGANWQSQQLAHSENRQPNSMKAKGSGKSHSWWWDSHNTPKNSKWLEDNLNVMDSKVKAMLKLIEEDADSFAKRAEMYYKKRPELVSLVEDFYRAYRSLAERYDQLTGHIRQIPQELQAQFGLSGDSSPGSPVSTGNVRRRAAGFSVFSSPGTPKRSQENDSDRKESGTGDDDDDSSSGSESESDSKPRKKRPEEMHRMEEESEQLRKDLEKGMAEQQALEKRLADLQGELKVLQQQNDQLHKEASSARSETATLKGEVERLMRENSSLGDEVTSRVQQVENLQKELNLSQEEQSRLSTRLEETGPRERELEAKIKELEAKIQQLADELLFSAASCERFEKELTALREEKSRLSNDVSVQAHRIGELEEQITLLEEALALSVRAKNKNLELLKSLEKKSSDLHIEFSSLQKEKSKLSEELLAGAQQVQSLEQQLRQAQEALESSETEKKKVVGLLSEMEKSLSDFQGEFASMQERLNGEISVQVKEKHALEEQVEELQATLAALHGEKSRGVEIQDVLEKRLMDLQQELSQAKQETNKLAGEKSEIQDVLEKRLMDLQQELSQAKQEANKLADEVVDKAAVVRRLEGDIQVRDETVGNLHGDLFAKQEEGKVLRNQLEDSSKDRQRLETEVQKLQALLRDSQDLTKALELKEHQQELELATMEASKLRDDLADRVAFVGRLEGEVQNRDKQVANLRDEISATLEEGQILRLQLEAGADKVKGLENELQKLQALLNDSKIENKALSSELQRSFESSSKLREEVDELQRFMDTLKNELVEGDAHRQKMDHDITILMGEKACLTEERVLNLDEIAKLGKELQDILEEKESYILTLDLELKRLNEDLSDSQQKSAIHVEQCQTLMGEKEGLELELALLHEANSKFQTEHASRIEQAQQLELSVKEMEDTISVMKKANSNLTSDLEMAMAKAHTAEEKCLFHEQMSSGLQEEKTKLAAQVGELELLISKLQEEIELIRKENEDLKITAQHDRQEKEAIETEIQALRDQISSTKQISQISQDKIIQLSEEISHLKTEISRLEVDLCSSTAQLKSFEEQQASWNLDRTRLHEGINLLTEEKREFQGTLRMWTEQMEKLEMDHANLKGKSRDVEESLLFHQTEHTKVQSELSEKSERLKMLEEELRKLRLELIGSQDEARRLSTELQKVTQERKDQLKAEGEKIKLLRDDVYNLQQNLLSAQEEREMMTNACQEHVKGFKVKEESMESQILRLKGEVTALDEHCKELVRKLEEKTQKQEALEVDKEELQQALLSTQQERESAKAECDSLMRELARECDNRSRAEENSAKLQVEIEGLLAEIAWLQAELQRIQGENETLTVRIKDALEQEGKDAMEIDTLLKALQSVHEENGSLNIEERSWHFEAKHPTLRHLKDRMLNLLADRSKIKQEAAAHAVRVEELNQEIVKAEQMLEVSKGEYHSLTGKHETVLKEMQALQLQVPQLEEQILFLEEEKRKLQDHLSASLRDSDEVSAELLKEKKELYEKLVVEGKRVLKLQEEIKMAREENIEHRRIIDDTREQIQKLVLDIQDLCQAKEEQEMSLKQEIQTYAEKLAKVEQGLDESHSALSLEKTEVSSLRDEISMKNRQLWKLEEEVALLKSTLTEKEQEFFVLQQHKESLEGRLAAELGNIQKMEGESFLWQEEKSSLISSLTYNEKKATELLEQLALLTQDKEKLSAELQAKVLSTDMQQQEIQKLYQQLESLKLRISSLVEHSSVISQKYDATASELENVQLLLSSLREENGRLGHDVLSRTISVTELTEVVSNVEKKNADLEAEVKLRQENAIILEEQVASLQQENDQLKQALKSGTEEMRVLTEEISNLQQLHLKLKNEHECLVHEKQRSFDEHSLILLRLEKVEKDLAFQQGENSLLETESKNSAARIQELEGIISQLEKEKQAFSVEIASTSLLMNDMQRRADGLQEKVRQLRSELKLGNEQLQQKNDEIQELSSMSKALHEERSVLSMELEKKIHDYSSLEATLCALQDEHLSLVDKNNVLSEEVASGTNLVVKLKEEIVVLRAEKEAQDKVIIRRTADIQRLQEDLLLVQDSEHKLRNLLDLKEQAVNQLEEEIERLKAALYGVQEEHKLHKGKLETEMKKLELVVFGLRDEKTSWREEHSKSLGSSDDLEALCKSLQELLVEQHEERSRLEARLSLIDELKKEAHDKEERIKGLQERIASKQHEIDHVQSSNEKLRELVRTLEGEVVSLKEQMGILQKKNNFLNNEVLIKASLIQELEQSFTSLKEEKVAFEGGLFLAIGNVGLVQAEVNKLLEKISKLTELSHATGEKLQKMEDRICMLQVSNLNLRDEVSGSAKKEKSYVIAVRFMRAEFFCLVQRIKALKEEKAEQARQAELAVEAERKRSGEVLSSLQQELVFLREENKRQRAIIFDRAEEKRQAIRQLCITLDFLQEKNRRLEGVINSVREKIRRRVAAAGARRN